MKQHPIEPKLFQLLFGFGTHDKTKDKARQDSVIEFIVYIFHMMMRTMLLCPEGVIS